MVGSQSCRASGLEGDLRATTFTGTDNKNVVCDIGTRQDVRHYVQLKNLLAYETRIKCTGQITSKPRFIKFEAPGDADCTEQEWTAECVLGNYGEHTFSHVKVISKQPGNGDQTIKVTLEIDRLRQRGTHHSASLQLTAMS